MTTAKDRMPLEELLAQARWARNLARQLVRDGASADDLVQRTWVAALEHPPALASHGAPATLRRWMASVMRNFVRQDVRESERRVQRETLAARSERTSDGIEEGLEGQRKLLEALRALPEPYRAVLYARYFDGLMPRDIARRDGTPLKTVKSQLARGLDLLRQRLDREHGGNRGAWMAWIVPMAAKSALPTAFFGALIVNSKVKSVAAVLVAVCLLAVGVRVMRRDATVPADTLSQATAPVLQTPPEESTLESSARQPVIVAEPANSTHAESSTPAPELSDAPRGRVLDLDNRPIGGVRISCERAGQDAERIFAELEAQSVRSDEHGSFELPAKARQIMVLVDDPRWVTVYEAFVSERTALEVTIFVAPKLEFSGVVVDPTHHPVEGAEIELRLSASIKRKLERRLDNAYCQNFLTKSDASGRFTLVNAPACDSELVATAPGWTEGKIPAPTLSASSLEIVLGSHEKPAAIVRGIVKDTAGAPIDGANVGIGGLTQVTGPDGRFTFDLDSTGYGELNHSHGVWSEKYPGNLLRALKRGLMPCEIVVPSIDQLRLDSVPNEYTLVLDGTSLTIRGHVVDADGKPVEDARISVLNETPFGRISTRNGESTMTRETSIEQLLRSNAYTGWMSSANDGSFAVTGLTARNYDLSALDPKTLRCGVLRDVAAGSSDVRIELPGNASMVHVAGRIVSRTGEGMAGLDTWMMRLPENSLRPDPIRDLNADSSGRFDLGTIDPERLRIQVTGEEIFPLVMWQPPAGAKFDELEVQVSLRCAVKLELTPTAPQADTFSFLDVTGKATVNLQFEGSSMRMPRRCQIIDGVSEVFAAEDSATTMLLFQADKEIARMPVHLTPGELTILRP